jgi:hypothetical protein
VRVKAEDMFDKNELYQTFTKLVGGRDEAIKQLVHKVSGLQSERAVFSKTVQQEDVPPSTELKHMPSFGGTDDKQGYFSFD